ncbi:hypothetical protein GCM10027047_24170 [Rhodococcus aerolatus]
MSTPAELLEATRAALDGYVDVTADDDGALTFLHAEVPCVVQAVELADGLVVLSITCVLAWDLPAGPALDRAVALAGAATQFGGVSLGERGVLADVTLRYAFPAAGLARGALATLLLLVVSSASRARTDVLAAL